MNNVVELEVYRKIRKCKKIKKELSDICKALEQNEKNLILFKDNVIINREIQRMREVKKTFKISLLELSQVLNRLEKQEKTNGTEEISNN